MSETILLIDMVPGLAITRAELVAAAPGADELLHALEVALGSGRVRLRTRVVGLKSPEPDFNDIGNTKRWWS